MRETFLTISLLSAFAFAEPACALEAGDSMSSWKGASAEEKAALVKEVLRGSGRAPLPIIKCVDDAAGVPGHSNLPIGEVVKACASSKDDSQPV